MRVLHFFKTYWPDSFGGMERAIHAIACGTAGYGIESEVLSLSRDPARNSVMFDGHMARKARLDLDIASTGLSLGAFSLFAERARAADIVHYHFPWPYMDVAHFVCRHGKPTVLTYQSDIVKQKRLKQLYGPLMRRFLGAVDRIVVASPNYLETSDDLRPFAGKTTVIPNGLAESDYPTPRPEALAAWRARFPQPFFLFTGVLRYYKGLHVLIEAARLSGLPFVIVGEGPMEAELRSQVARLGLDNVAFVGAVSDDDKMALLSLCQGFVFPSHLRSEAFGLSLVEAAMVGKPMISCEIGTGTTYINRAGETGLAVPPSDPAALAQAMRELAQAPEHAAHLGRQARARYLSTFTAERMSAAYAALYRDLLSSRRSAIQ